jgi:hypothetical protein
MLALVYDRPSALLLALLGGAPHAEDEWGQLIDAIRELDRNAAADGLETLLVAVTTPETPRPDATWRRRFAELKLELKAKRRYSALVTTSLLLRGAMTAINWIVPPSRHGEVVVFGTFDEAAAWCVAERGRRRQALYAMLDQACAELGLSRITARIP